MYSAFNSNFEISLRLLTLMSHTMRSMDLDEIYIVDFIATYARAFSVSEKSINGDNQFMYCEFASRRELVRRALRDLMMMGLVNIKQSDSGLEYTITDEGINISDSLDSYYCRQYKTSIIDAYEHFGNKTTDEIINMISAMSINAIRSGEGR